MANSADDAGRLDEATETVERDEAKGSRPASAEPILRARPVAGEIDYTALIREHMARYPKILAELAK